LLVGDDGLALASVKSGRIETPNRAWGRWGPFSSDSRQKTCLNPQALLDQEIELHLAALLICQGSLAT
jgi:hypothetical protein